MAQCFWSRWWRWMRGSTTTTGAEADPLEVRLAEVHATLGEEFRGVRKMLRKQAQVLEELHGRQGHESPAVKGRTKGSSIELATAFFHLHQSLRERVAESPAHREAIALFWLQLDRSLQEIDVRMIREEGAPFDARLHRAVLSRGEGSGEWVVVEVLEPGFIRGDMVSVPAKVILGHHAALQCADEENL
ncbi:MAG: nucleotide exchange factor GrpE [Desulfobulbus sp.]|nr:nucleotide exchange factor GrpE [Desulfobulbus sp.]